MWSEVEWDVIGLSLKVAFFATAINLPLGILTAWLLTRSRLPLKPLLRAITLLPLVLPPVVVGYLLIIVFAPAGLIGGFLEDLGIQIAFDWKGAVIASWVMSFPLMTRSVMIAMEQHDWRLESASRALGVGPVRTFMRVTLPLMTPGILSGTVLAFSRGFGEFGATIALCASIPGKTQTLPLAIFEALQRPGGGPHAWRLTLICALVAVTAIAASEWLSRRTRS